MGPVRAHLKVGQGEGDDAIEAARPGEGGVQGGWSVGGCNDHHASVVLKPIHLRQQLVDGVHRLCINTRNLRRDEPRDGPTEL